MEIARWTTPSVTYKPALVEAANIDEIVLTVTQGPYAIIKTQADAIITGGRFYWKLTQEETGGLVLGKTGNLKIDYLSNVGDRYTTQRFIFNVSNSAIDEVITI